MQKFYDVEDNKNPLTTPKIPYARKISGFWGVGVLV